MKLLSRVGTVLLAGIVSGFWGQALANPVDPENSSGEVGVPQVAMGDEKINSAEPFDITAMYCYEGSIMDETTGEILDLYGLCAADFEIA